MNPSELSQLLVRLSKATKNQPTADDIDLIVECVLDNRLNDDEIKAAYRACRDAPEPWWPKPGEFLARARPPANTAAIGTEAETILQLILDHPLLYGAYNPETGTVYDRRKIEARHGRAAGEAFGSIQGRIRTMETLSDEKWVRVEFCRAYGDARSDYGAPLALTPPNRRIAAPKGTSALSGGISDDEFFSRIDPEMKEKIDSSLADRSLDSLLEMNFDERKAMLIGQARAMVENPEEYAAHVLECNRQISERGRERKAKQ